MPLRSCQEFLKAEQQARLSLSLFTTKMHVLPTIRILPDTIVPDMQTTPLMPSTVSEITVAADVHRPGIKICAYSKAIGPVSINPAHFNAEDIFNNPVYMPDMQAAAEAEAFIAAQMEKQDSCGGIIECRIQGMPAGIGDPVFEKLNANLAKAICSIGAVKGFEIGDGFSAARSQGSVNNDAFTTDAAGHITKATNHAGGILGGMSDSSEIIFRAAIKPTPSISRTQHTVTREGEPIDIQIKGRHDPIIVPRAVVVVQSMAALVLIDALMQNMTARVDYLRDFYKN